MSPKFANKFPLLALFIGIIIIYVIIQIRYDVFNLSYVWDEHGVYSKIAIHLFYRKLSLLPSSVPDELSRGHPLLCGNYFALAFKLFGCTPLVGHIAAALLNTLGVYFCYRIISEFANQWIAVFATLAIFVQPLILSQASLLMPEMPLTVCTLAAIYYYFNNKIISTSIWLIVALQIKESAIILPVAFLITDLLVNRKVILKNIFYLFLLPMITFSVFLLIQKYQLGYYFFPFHTSLMHFDWYHIHEKWNSFYAFLLHHQGRYWVITSTCILTLFFLIINRKNLKNYFKHKLILLPIIICGGVFFLLPNVFLARYSEYFFILIYVLMVLLIIKTFKNYWYIQLPLLALVLVSGTSRWNDNKKYTDIDFSYTNHVKSIHMMVSELENEKYKNKMIGTSFPFCPLCYNMGFTINNTYKTCINTDTSVIIDYRVFTHPGSIEDTIKYMDKMILEKKLTYGYAYSAIYKVVKK